MKAVGCPVLAKEYSELRAIKSPVLKALYLLVYQLTIGFVLFKIIHKELSSLFPYPGFSRARLGQLLE